MPRKRIIFGGEEAEVSSFENSQIAVLPVPYEATTTYVRGTKHGPEAILRASQNMELYDEELDAEIFRKGIYTLPPLRFQGLRNGSSGKKGFTGTHAQKLDLKMIEEEVESIIINEKFPVILGGEHSVSIGVVSALRKKYRDLTVVQFDAHADLRESYCGSEYNHACTMARITEMCPAVQLGIRSMSAEESERIKLLNARNTKRKNLIVFAADMQDGSWIARTLARISGTVYVTIDLDYFDPSIMPSVGTPEPGGGKWYPTLEFLKKLSKKTQIVGFDVVELCPQRGNPAPDFLASKLIYKLLGYIFCSESHNKP